MNNNSYIESTKKFTSNLSKSIPKGLSIVETTNVFSTLTEIKKCQADIKKSEAEIRLLQVKETIIVEEMSKKYELYHKVFNTIFQERSDAINKSFDIIDKGLKEDDKELISIGLNTLSTVVASSPFANLNELGNLLDSGNTIEL